MALLPWIAALFLWQHPTLALVCGVAWLGSYAGAGERLVAPARAFVRAARDVAHIGDGIVAATREALRRAGIRGQAPDES